MQKHGEPNSLVSLSDDSLLSLCAAGNDEAQELILKRYKNLVRSKARSYFLIGGDDEDIMQEGMIGLYKALRDYDPEKQSSFRTFADLCITRQIITAIKSATRNKHIPLNHYISLSNPAFENEGERTLLDVISEGASSDPESIFIINEATEEAKNRISCQLSNFEKSVLSLFLEGLSYVEISSLLGKSQKSIDNALQRIKKKLGRGE